MNRPSPSPLHPLCRHQVGRIPVQSLTGPPSGARFRFMKLFAGQPCHPSLSVSLAVWLVLRAANPSFWLFSWLKSPWQSDVHLETPAVLFQLLSPRWGGAAFCGARRICFTSTAPTQELCPLSQTRAPAHPMTGCFEFPSPFCSSAIPLPWVPHPPLCLTGCECVHARVLPTTVPDSPFLYSLNTNRPLAKSSWTAQKSSAY